MHFAQLPIRVLLSSIVNTGMGNYLYFMNSKRGPMEKMTRNDLDLTSERKDEKDQRIEKMKKRRVQGMRELTKFQRQMNKKKKVLKKQNLVQKKKRKNLY